MFSIDSVIFYVRILICTVLRLLTGSHLTGMFMHPAMASTFSFDCGPTPIYQHLTVYWLGPFTGAFLSMKLAEIASLPPLGQGKKQEISKKTESTTMSEKDQQGTKTKKKDENVRQRKVKKS